MALPLVEWLTDEAIALMVQLGIEYGPKPHGAIPWNTVDRDLDTPVLVWQLRPPWLTSRNSYTN